MQRGGGERGIEKEREEKLNSVGQWYFTTKEVRRMKSNEEFNSNIRKMEAYKSELIRLVSRHMLLFDNVFNEYNI